MLTENPPPPIIARELGEPIITLEHISKRFGKLQALADVSLEVRRREVLMIIGPSGSGKSTLLRCINHLEVPDSGRVEIDGITLTNQRTNINKVREEVGMVFQRFELFPHLSVLDNITLAQRVVRKRSAPEASRIAMELLEKVGIPEKAQAQPAQLSGGQQQRVAIARALAMQPKIML
ncbi:MAG TPA: ATP-binding cassette domain-containing protein, partial [Chloroflexia bacterium]|nr:ATP-binding cassette domain-containing protein [Chloroflexia bacterium]